MVLTASTGKGKAIVSPELPSPVEEAESVPSLEAFMTDLTLFEESLLKYLEEEVICGLVSMYGRW